MSNSAESSFSLFGSDVYLMNNNRVRDKGIFETMTIRSSLIYPSGSEVRMDYETTPFDGILLFHHQGFCKPQARRRKKDGYQGAAVVVLTVVFTDTVNSIIPLGDVVAACFNRMLSL